MAVLTRDEIEGKKVYTSDDEKLGKVDSIWYDHATNGVEWIAVKPGFLSSKRILVPLEGARLDGDDVRVEWTKAQIEGAPDIDDTAFESDDDEKTLYSHYGMQYPGRSFAAHGDTYSRTWDEVPARETVPPSTNGGVGTPDAGSRRLQVWRYED